MHLFSPSWRQGQQRKGGRCGVSAIRRVCVGAGKLSSGQDWSRVASLQSVAARKRNSMPRVTDAVDHFSYAQDEVCCLQAFY